MLYYCRLPRAAVLFQPPVASASKRANSELGISTRRPSRMAWIVPSAIKASVVRSLIPIASANSERDRKRLEMLVASGCTSMRANYIQYDVAGRWRKLEWNILHGGKHFGIAPAFYLPGNGIFVPCLAKPAT